MGVLSAASGYSTAFQGRAAAMGLAPLPPPVTPTVPQFGRLELPAAESEGPPDGLTLDAAIDRLIQVNPDLLSKGREIPKARADAITAGLRANPIVFFSADSIPYGGYSTRRPGSNSYGIVLVQPIDVNHKRRYRVIVAEQARAVLEAQYADAVRLGIDQLGTAFVDVLEARETLRYKQANVDRLNKMVDVTRQLLRRSNQARPDLDRMAILRDTAEIELDAARSNLTQALRSLAVLLQVPEADSDALSVRGTIRDAVPPPPPVNDLVALAVCNRPDVVAYQRGVKRAMADVDLTRRERFEDIFLFYTPYGFTNYAYEGQQSATSWSLGAPRLDPAVQPQPGQYRAGPGGRDPGSDRALGPRAAGRVGGAAGRAGLRDDRQGRPAVRARYPRPRRPAARRRAPPLRRGRADRRGLLQRRARLQRGRPPVLRQPDPPPPQHAPAQHGCRPAHTALTVSHPARARVDPDDTVPSALCLRGREAIHSRERIRKSEWV